jgi:hypothetical protein
MTKQNRDRDHHRPLIEGVLSHKIEGVRRGRERERERLHKALYYRKHDLDRERSTRPRAHARPRARFHTIKRSGVDRSAKSPVFYTDYIKLSIDVPDWPANVNDAINACIGLLVEFDQEEKSDMQHWWDWANRKDRQFASCSGPPSMYAPSMSPSELERYRQNVGASYEAELPAGVRALVLTRLDGEIYHHYILMPTDDGQCAGYNVDRFIK